jgi:hypothetical protein
MRVLFLGMAILLFFAGCAHIKESSPGKELGSAVFSGNPGYPSQAFVLIDGRTLIAKRFFQGKEKQKSFVVNESDFEELRSLFKQAFNELKSVAPVQGIAGGTNIRIVLNGDQSNPAVLKNYAARFYKLENFPALNKKLESLVPSKFWRY